MINDIAIPVRVAGLGSQPVETDGAELDILQLPSGMDSYSAAARTGDGAGTAAGIGAAAAVALRPGPALCR